jgi:acyl-coenzyme A thioesterase PaaI-like protein
MIEILYEPHPLHDGWMSWKATIPDAFHNSLGDIAVRPEGDGRARVRWWPEGNVANVRGGIHGGAILGFLDIALFAGARACGVADAATSATIDCSCQFLGPASMGEPVDAAVELLRETGRLVFLRGTLEQGGPVAAFSAVLRKIKAA